MSLEPSASTDTPAAAAPRRAGFGWRRWCIVIVSVALLSLLGVCAWVIGSEQGTAWALAQQDRVVVEQLRGNLFDGFSAQRIVVHWGPAREHRVVIDTPRASGLRFARGSTGAWLRIHAERAAADRVSVQLAPSTAAAKLPAHLRLPVEIEVDAASVGTLELPRLAGHPLRNAQAQVHLGAEQGQEHRLGGLRFGVGPLQWSGNAQIGAEGTLPLRLQLEATQATHPDAPQLELPPWARALRRDWHARLEASGPLARFSSTVVLRAQGQRLDAKAEVAPLQAWPLPRLDVHADQLDLSSLIARAPATALTGDIRIEPLSGAVGRAGALTAQAKLINQRPGRWDQHGLPLRDIRFDLRAANGAAGRIEVTKALATLAGDGSDAGSVQGSGEWNAGKVRLQARLTQVRPSLLDPRLAAMTLSGPLTLGAQFAPGAGPAGQVGSVALSEQSASALPRLELKADLAGQFDDDATRAVELKLDLDASAHRVAVRQMLAKVGSASLSLSGNARRASAAEAWRIEAKTSLSDFDPVLWFPGAPESTWRRGPHRFNADAEIGLILPLDAQAPDGAGKWQEWLEWLPTMQGQARINLRPSQLAGVPLRGEAALRYLSPTETGLTAHLDAGGNSVRASGQWTRGDAGRSDRWELDIRAAHLARLAPWRALAKVPSNFAMPAGTLDADVKVEGRWPQLRTRGRLDAQALRYAQLSVERGQARWNFEQTADAPFQLKIDLTDARWQKHRAQSLEMNLEGTMQAHTLGLRAELRVGSPAWAGLLSAMAPGEQATPGSTLVQLDAHGALGAQTGAAPGLWQGTVDGFELRSSEVNAAVLLRLRDVGLELQAGDTSNPSGFELKPGRGELLGAAMRWDRIFWKAATATAPARIDIKAQIDPLAVAPLLARAQPHFGWRGDLTVGGQVNIQSEPKFQADLVLERVSGDLGLSGDQTATQELQLTDLRVALSARDGVWSFTQALAGKTIGEAAGAVSVRVAPNVIVPSAETPIEGVFEARVANLGTWGGWVPPGWRLSGNLSTSGAIEGRLGAPLYTGQIRGSSIGVRSILHGVNVVDGEVDIRLQGESAHIQRFQAKTGAGTIRIEGDASMGAAPKAQLLVTAEKFELLGRVDRRVVASGNAKLTLDAQTLKLDGRIKVDEGLIDFTRRDAPKLADDVRIGVPSAARQQLSEPPSAPAPATARNVVLDLQVALGQQLRLRGRGLDTRLRGDLHLTTPGAKLAINGKVGAASGTYAAYGQKLSIDRGELIFTGVPENPRLDIVATRPNLEQVVGVLVTGTALNPRVRLFSEPEMAEIDKLSWLVLGRASDGLGRTDTALMQRAAIGLLAGEGSGPTDELINALGLDDVSFRQTEGEVRETIVSLGKQLSRRWYVGYERSLNATTGKWQIIYRIAQRLTLRAQSGQDNSLDAIWTWRWQ
jgi:translocation and assembly module TamB